MRRRALLFLAVVCVPAVALANVITVGNHVLLPNSVQVIDIYMTGTDFYNDSEMWILINGGVGPAPVITHVFGDTGGPIPQLNLAGSIWTGGGAGFAVSPDGTFPTDSGLSTAAAFITAGAALQNTAGIYATLTLDTTGMLPNTSYSISLTDHSMGSTGLFIVLSDPVPVPLEIINGSFTVTPEPASVVMGLFALAGLAAVAVRRRFQPAGAGLHRRRLQPERDRIVAAL